MAQFTLDEVMSRAPQQKQQFTLDASGNMVPVRKFDPVADNIESSLKVQEKLIGKGFKYRIDNVRKKLKDKKMSPENAINPYVTDYSDTPDAILAGLPPDVAEEIKQKYMTEGFDATTGEMRPFFNVSTRDLRQKIDMDVMRAKNPVLAEQIEETTPVEAALIGMGRGVATVGRGLGLMKPADETEEQAYQALKGQMGAMGAAEVVGEAGPFIGPGLGVSALRTTGARVAGGASVGATEAGVVTRGKGGNDEQVAKSMLVGGALGGLGEGLLRLINGTTGKIAQARTPDVPAENLRLLDDGTPTPELQQWLDSQNMTVNDLVNGTRSGFDDPLMNAERARAFDELGVPMTEAERSRSPTLFANQNKLATQDGPVAELVSLREAQLDRMTREAVEQTGGRPQSANESIRAAIVGKSDDLNRQIDSLYEQARQQATDQRVVRFDSARNVIMQNMPRNQSVNNVVSSLRNQMQQIGVLDRNMRASGRINVEQAEQLRQYANSLRNDSMPGVNRIISDFNSALDDDVFRAVDSISPESQQLFVRARQAKRDYEQALGRDRIDRYDQNRTEIIREIQENRVNLDKLSDDLLRRSSKYTHRDLDDLRHFLTTGTDAQVAAGYRAWDDLRAAAIDKIYEKAFVGSVSQSGTQTLSRAALDRVVESIGERKMATLFSPREREFIERLRRVAAAKEAPAGSKSYGPSEASQLFLRQSERIGNSFFVDVVRSVLSSRKKRIAEKQVLQLRDDLEEIFKQNQKVRSERLRKSAIGSALRNAPLFGIPAAIEESQ